MTRTAELIEAAVADYLESPETHWELVPCRIWTGATTTDGYGLVRSRKDGGKARLVTRIILSRIIPNFDSSSLLALHRCDVPSCYEPLHLFPGTAGDNNRDRHKKGRSGGGSMRGTKNPASKFTPKQIRAMRSAVGPIRELGKRFGISVPHLIDIRKKRAWGHI